LQRKTFAAEEARSELALPSEFERHAFFRAQKCLFATNERLPRHQLLRDDGAGKARREGDVPLAFGDEVGDKKAAAGKTSFQSCEKSAAGMRIHADIVAHPRHAICLAIKRFTARHFDGDGLHDGTGYLVAQSRLPRPDGSTAHI
jgi:hypothetical protein